MFKNKTRAGQQQPPPHAGSGFGALEGARGPGPVPLTRAQRESMEANVQRLRAWREEEKKRLRQQQQPPTQQPGRRVQPKES